MTREAGTPDYQHGYLRLPLAVWSALYCRAPFTRRQLQLVSVVLRESWGWQTKEGRVYRWTRPLTVRQFSQATGLATDHLTRDLRALVDDGILCEQRGRYQLVPEPALWKTRGLPPPKWRREGEETAVATAKAALSASVLKKAKKEERNVPHLPESGLSPVVNNSSPPALPPTGSPGNLAVPRRAGREVGSAERLVLLIESFVGPLSPTEARRLQEWTAEAGVVPVWDALEPFFRQGARATRDQLQQRLRERQSLPADGPQSAAEKAAHA